MKSLHENRAVELRAVDAISDDTMTAINRFSLKPLTAEDVAVFTMELCNNQIDAHNSRFPDEELARIAPLTIGRPFMELHDTRGRLPRGLFFRATVKGDSDVKSVCPDVYVLRTEENAHLIKNIEGGVWRETSIGFEFTTPECSICAKDLRECEHIPGRDYEAGTCHYIMRDVTKVIEGSLVPAGSQGTQITSQLRSVADALEQRDLTESSDSATNTGTEGNAESNDSNERTGPSLSLRKRQIELLELEN